jgi:phage baseplate assembly protein W
MEQSGFPFPAIRQGGFSGPLVYVSKDTLALIRASIYQILTTTPGERPWLPEFGCAAQTMVFENATSTIMNTIATLVYQALTKWEPRIQVSPSSVFVENLNGNIQVTISYKIKVTLQSGITSDVLVVSF